MEKKIAVLPGDGIGPEVTGQAEKVLKVIAGRFGHNFVMNHGLFGGAALDQVGSGIPEETWELCFNSDAILLGAMGGPKWDNDPRLLNASLLTLRSKLGLYANLRPAVMFSELTGVSPLKNEIVEGTDVLVIRELTGGLYYGQKGINDLEEGGTRAFDTMTYTTAEIERIARVAFEAALKRHRKVTSVDKANVLVSSRLWREVVTGLAKEYPGVELEHILVDNCAMQIVRNPKQFDVLVSENTFADILSDQFGAVVGSLGMLPSASLGGKVALYEPVHGSAPDIEGQDKANPLAAILSAALLLRYSFDLDGEAKIIEGAVSEVLKKYRTADIYQEGTTLVGCSRMGDLVAGECMHREKGDS